MAYPQHTLWMMMSVIKSAYPQRIKRCTDVFADPHLKEPHMLKLVNDFTQLAEKMIELCNKPIVGHGSVRNSIRWMDVDIIITRLFAKLFYPNVSFVKLLYFPSLRNHFFLIVFFCDYRTQQARSGLFYDSSEKCGFRKKTVTWKNITAW